MFKKYFVIFVVMSVPFSLQAIVLDPGTFGSAILAVEGKVRLGGGGIGSGNPLSANPLEYNSGDGLEMMYSFQAGNRTDQELAFRVSEEFIGWDSISSGEYLLKQTWIRGSLPSQGNTPGISQIFIKQVQYDTPGCAALMVDGRVSCQVGIPNVSAIERAANGELPPNNAQWDQCFFEWFGAEFGMWNWWRDEDEPDCT